jgi:hypothetical protein
MLLELEWPAATDDSAVMYNVYVDGELIVDNWTGTKLSGYKVCEGVAPPIGRNLRGGRFEVRATDPSGNVSDDALTVTFDPACPGTLDAGPGPSEQDGSGCSVAGGASRLPAIAALLVAVAIRRRRRW